MSELIRLLLAQYKYSKYLSQANFFLEEVPSPWHSKHASSAHDLTKTFLSFLPFCENGRLYLKQPILDFYLQYKSVSMQATSLYHDEYQIFHKLLYFIVRYVYLITIFVI